MSPATAERRGAAAVLAEGEMLAPGYEVIAHLSRAEALDVYDVWSLERDCRAIAKLARPDRPEERVQARLENEGRLLLALAHPNIVRAYELLPTPEPVLILETLPGQTLAHMIETARRRLSVADIAELGLQLCSAIGYLHTRGQLHLDLKPANVIAHAGTAKVIDLSLARPPGRAPRGLGTSGYLPPEQARGDVVGEAADVWGIGATLFEAATGSPPFPGARRGAYPQLGEPAPRISDLRRAPRALIDLLADCLAKSPSERPAVGALADRLEALLA